jgi:hypothetical protein
MKPPFDANPKHEVNALEQAVAGLACQANGSADLAQFVAATSALFFWAERGANPRVQTYWDALHYVATSLSVGYANMFPETPLGKIIGAVVMMVGPALSARALDTDERVDNENLAIVERLDAILAELRRQNGTAAPPAAES